ncbi:MAG: hypothetical protein ACXWN9_12865, partial [Candidatus Binataceae bacterium]
MRANWNGRRRPFVGIFIPRPPEYRQRQENERRLIGARRHPHLENRKRKPELAECVSGAEVPDMNVSFARRIFSRRILSASAGLILIAAPILATAAAADPYHDPDDVAAYQAYTAQY